MTNRPTTKPAYRWLLWGTLIAWAIPLTAIGCAQFLRGTYLPGEYLNPKDELEFYGAYAGWFVAAFMFTATLVLRARTSRRHAIWSIILSGVYALTPFLILANLLLSMLLHKFPI